MTIPVRIPKKLAMINDMAGYGRCSTTEALPIISAMKVQVCPVPTSLFSNHTGFPVHYMLDCTNMMREYLKKWRELKLHFDGIYCGFLASERQADIVRDFVSSCENTLFILDPVMGDNGKAYRTVTPEHTLALRSLLPYADIITPNLTEACLLTDTPYREGSFSADELAGLMERLHGMGPERVVITGIRDGEDYLNYLSEPAAAPETAPEGNSISTPLEASALRRHSLAPAGVSGLEAPGTNGHVSSCQETVTYRLSVVRSHSAGHPWHGTGDIFASILAADAVNGVPFAASVEKASSFIRTCIQTSTELGIPEPDGVCFENFLSLLIPEDTR